MAQGGRACRAPGAHVGPIVTRLSNAAGQANRSGGIRGAGGGTAAALPANSERPATPAQ